MHLPAIISDAHGDGVKVVTESCPEHDQQDRIRAALGPLEETCPASMKRRSPGTTSI